MTRLEWNYEWTPHSTTRVLYKRARCGRLRYLLLSANKIPVQRFAHVLIRLSLWRRHFLGSITSWLTIQKVVPSIVRYLPTFSFISNSTCALTSFLLILFPIIHLVFPTILAVATFYSTNNNVLYFFFFRSFKGFFSSLSILFDFSKRKKKYNYIQMTVALLIIRWQKVLARSWLEIWLWKNRANVFFRKIGRSDTFCISNNSLLIQLNLSIVSVIYPSWSEYFVRSILE